MKPTLKKPSGKLTGQNLPTTAQNAWAFKHHTGVAVEQDEEETDANGEDESEDIKPARGLTRSSSVGCFKRI